MIVLEHTNPSTIYLDYHYWLPERGASGIMIGGEYYRYTDSGAFITCNPSPGGELGLGSPLTKNKSTFSDYHSNNGTNCVVNVGSWWIDEYWSEYRDTPGLFCVTAFQLDISDHVVCSRLSLFSALATIIMNVLDQEPMAVMIEN